MIKIVGWDGVNQFDEDGNAITEWNEKYCAWVVLPEYEEAYKNGEIDWWGEDNDFPSGLSLEELKKLYPNADNNPDITVIWTWDKDGYRKEFHEPLDTETTFCCRSWGYLDYSKEEAIELVGKYCDWNVTAFNTKVIYNGETIFDGKLD